ncbi:MAG: hypothetical protein D6737_16960 [Chloroflexi bacterium]|nr:MAG: hypothetical protein D6737_16960 [Chloroflexota bacterium]
MFALRLFTFLLAFVVLSITVSIGAGLSVADTAYAQSIGGKIVYTADALDTNEDGVIDATDNDIMFSIEIGADPATDRFRIAGGPPASAAYPRLTDDAKFVLCHAFTDTDGDGVIDHQKDMPFVAILGADGADLTPLTMPGNDVSLEANFSPDEKSIVFTRATADTDGDGQVTINDTRQLAIKPLGVLNADAPKASDFADDSEPMILTDDDITVSRPQFWTETMVLFEARRLSDDRLGVYVYDLEQGTMTRISPEDMDATNPQISPDGTQIVMQVAAEAGSRIWVYDAAAETLNDVTPLEGSASDASWSPDGSTLAMVVASADTSDLVLYDGSTTDVLVTEQGVISMTAFAPDGESIAYALTTDETTSLNVVSLDQAFMAKLTPDDTRLVEFVWSPDEKGT